MKKMLLYSLLLTLFCSVAGAQTTSTKKKISSKKAVVKKQSPSAISNTPQGTVVLSSTSGNAAYSNRLSISDPTITALNERTLGAPIRLSSSGVVGMPKGTYGYARGKIFLRSTTATSSGTGYGSGSVATGTSINSIGTSESTIGVNGKSPYAGVWLWGTQQPVYNLPSKAATTKDNGQQ